ncbi:ABC transporter substrate-binding protein [Bacillus pinisoli]|uniref:ABC transporter substrate-binding protein n=1 Tax=Bacillus pinisoli TaxID=2901866 RepID=UPI001FF0E28D|nr:ABC transporter substrate-binding protein [Bacillus pinisoli]
MKKWMSMLSMIMVSVMFMTACGANEQTQETAQSTEGEAKKPSLNIGYVSILANAPGIVADKKGFFAEKLDVKTYGFNSGPELYQAFASGDLDVAYAGVPALVNWASRGLPVKVISKVNEGSIGVVVSEGSEVTSLDQLKGSVIAGVQRGSGVDIITRGLLLPKAGLLNEDVTIQEFKQPNIEAAIDSNQAQAGVLNEPFLTYALLHGKKQIAEEKDPALVIIVSEDALKNKPEAIKAFMEVHQSTISYLNNDQEDGNEVLVDVFNIQDVAGVKAVDVIAQAKEKMVFDWQFSQSDFDFYQQLADVAFELGYVDQEVDVSSLFDLTVVEGVVKE